jgi:hypothetical protein
MAGVDDEARPLDPTRGLMTGIWPSYDAYQARTSRVIPVVVLETSGR